MEIKCPKCHFENPDDTLFCGKCGTQFPSPEKAYEKHDMELFRLKYNPRFDPIRDDPRFQDLLRRMNFPK